MNIHGDIALMLKDLGTKVTDGTRTTFGMVDSADELLRDSGSPAAVIASSVVVTFRTGDLTATPGARLTIGSTTYIVREKLALDDGMLTQAICAKAGT